jgi:cytidylate kinase
VTRGSIESIVSLQVQRWEALQRVHRPEPRLPCIALSRLPYSGGGELGRRVAERLDYGLFDREMIDEIEREQGVQRRLLEGLDERFRNAIDRYVTDAFRGRSFRESEYLKHVVRTITTLAERGMAVLVGRGAPFVVEPDLGLRVLVVAPVVFRVERLAKARDLPVEEARDKLADEDRRRRDFVRHQFHLDQQDPVLYDLVVNTGTLSMDGAVRLVLDALRDRFPEAGPRVEAARPV